ncbi:MAG: phenylacetate--CoA ligase family protein, partial [Proteobacteria bacterium]|nr:phenylacetate--CoA ligase family protein [Pseudomonadota bacterium]
VGSEYQVILDRKSDGKDYMLIKAERANNASPKDDEKLKKLIEREVKQQVLVSGDVEIVGYATLPRSERKTKRVFDNRG